MTSIFPRMSRMACGVAIAPWRALHSGLGKCKEDSACLREAASRRLTLVTYDRRTIPPLLKTWAEEGRRHDGVVFMDKKSISPTDIGGLIRALIWLFKETGRWEWTDRLYFLRSQS